MGIVGIYTSWMNPATGREMFSFAMLTVNAHDHPVMERFHRPGKEKRMVVFLAPEQYDEWLACPVAHATAFFRQWMGPLDAEQAPLPPRAPRTYSGKLVVPPAPLDRPSPDPKTGELC